MNVLICSPFYNFKNKKILDVGCGTGFYSKYAIDKNAEVIAVDASQEMLDHLARQTPRQD